MCFDNDAGDTTQRARENNPPARRLELLSLIPDVSEGHHIDGKKNGAYIESPDDLRQHSI
jgi:hypothetical protein